MRSRKIGKKRKVEIIIVITVGQKFRTLFMNIKKVDQVIKTRLKNVQKINFVLPVSATQMKYLIKALAEKPMTRGILTKNC
jgi:hypothetical protein